MSAAVKVFPLAGAWTLRVGDGFPSTRRSYRENLKRIIYGQNKPAQKAVNTKKHNMQVGHKIYRSVWNGIQAFSGRGMEYIKLCHMRICDGYAISSVDVFYLPRFLIVPQNRRNSRRDSTLGSACVNDAVSVDTFVGMRIDDSDWKDRTIDSIAAVSKGAVSYGHQYMWMRSLSGI